MKVMFSAQSCGQQGNWLADQYEYIFEDRDLPSNNVAISSTSRQPP